MANTLQELPQHSVRALVPVLDVMSAMGFSSADCLQGTGLALAQLANPDLRITLEQEIGFYRNVLTLSGDPCIGLRLGQPFVPQRYGLFGYALLSAATFRHSLSLVEKFGRLTFSFYNFRFGVEGRWAWFAMCDPPPLDTALLNLYLDRDMSAAVVGFHEIMGERLPIKAVHLTHDGQGSPDTYRRHFDCEVVFGAQEARLLFDSSLLDQPLPQSDPESSRHLQQQCQMLIAKLSSHGSFVDRVRMLVLARPGYFPDIDYVAEKIGVSTRTLRRRLREEDSSYRELLDEVRFGLAREYLASTRLPMEEISRLLGYTEAGNFSHAFRRWSGESPSDWRLANASP